MHLIAKLLSNFQKRNIQWQTMRIILQLCGLSPSRGWEETTLKLEKEISQNSSDYIENLKKLEICYGNYLLTGQKAVKIFRMDSSELSSLCGILKSHELPTTIYDETYPFPLNKHRLKEVNSAPELVEIREINESLALVFCTKRNVSETIKIDPAELGIERNSYDEIIGKRRYTDQFFDVVFLRPNSGLVEIRVDTRLYRK
ncbi:MAG: hypothetical protein ACFB0G_22440 [Leptolyngbyaceae cyanobacterium]